MLLPSASSESITASPERLETKAAIAAPERFGCVLRRRNVADVHPTGTEGCPSIASSKPAKRFATEGAASHGHL
ncbi:unnamed protein product [Victoria cruziana]